MIITAALFFIIGVVFTAVGVIRLKKERDRLNDELIFMLADRDSYRNMYGPNPITRKPDISGTISEYVLMDTVGLGDPICFYLVSYNCDLDRWEDITDGQPITHTKNAVWYRLQLKKYEDKRLSR
jgi:hypothetical protein